LLTFRDQLKNDLANTFFNESEFADPCSYTQGGLVVSDVVVGLRKDADYDAIDEEGLISKVLMTEWHIPAADFGDVEPRVGDVIEMVDGEKTYKYEVMPPGANIPAVQLDVLLLVWRVSTKRVA